MEISIENRTKLTKAGRGAIQSHIHVFACGFMSSHMQQNIIAPLESFLSFGLSCLVKPLKKNPYKSKERESIIQAP